MTNDSKHLGHSHHRPTTGEVPLVLASGTRSSGRDEFAQAKNVKAMVATIDPASGLLVWHKYNPAGIKP